MKVEHRHSSSSKAALQCVAIVASLVNVIKLAIMFDVVNKEVEGSKVLMLNFPGLKTPWGC